MQRNKKIIEIAEKLPHGAKKKIAKSAGVSYPMVVSFFKGKEVGFYTETKIIAETQKLINLMTIANQAKTDLLNFGI